MGVVRQSETFRKIEAWLPSEYEGVSSANVDVIIDVNTPGNLYRRFFVPRASVASVIEKQESQTFINALDLEVKQMLSEWSKKLERLIITTSNGEHEMKTLRVHLGKNEVVEHLSAILGVNQLLLYDFDNNGIAIPNPQRTGKKEYIKGIIRFLPGEHKGITIISFYINPYFLASIRRK